MKILPLFLALALMLSVDSFAQNQKIKCELREDGRYCNGVKAKRVEPRSDCSSLEIKEDGVLYEDGKNIENLPVGDRLARVHGCSGKIKGREYATPEYSKKRFCSKHPNHFECSKK